MKKHSFNIELATKLQSIEKAVILENMSYWITKNLANNSNIHNGNVYTYNSYDALIELFPYMKLNTLKRVIKELENDNIIESRTDLNSSKWDKTKWYSIACQDTQKYLFTDDEIAKLSIVRKITIEEEKNNHREVEKQPSLICSNINTDINTDKKTNKKENLPKDLNIKAFKMWIEYKGKSYTKQGRTLSINKLIKYPKDIQMQMVENSIMNNYKGLFEVKQPKPLTEKQRSEQFFARKRAEELEAMQKQQDFLDVEAT